MLRAAISVALALVIASTGVRSARADDVSEAQLRFELGRERYRQRRFDEALEHFLASNRLVPNANVVFNIAQTYGLLGRSVEAFNWYETYLAMEGPADVRARAEEAMRRLLPRVAVVDVRTEPSGATLFIDRAELGTHGASPRRVAVTAGDHRVLARLDGHHEAVVSVVARAAESVPAALTLEPITGALEVTTTPAGATVRLETTGAELGRTPLSTRLPIGEVRLLITHEGFVDRMRTVVVRAEEPARVELALQRAASMSAVLTLRGGPAGADVLLGDRPIGELPLSLGGLPPGEARLTIRADGHEPWSGDVPLEAGGATRVDVTLIRPEDRPWRGWRALGYAAGGALLATGLSLGLVGWTQRHAFFDQPGRHRLDRVESLSLASDVLMAVGATTLLVTLLVDLVRSRPASHAEVSIER